MAETVDTRVVEAKFDSSQFEKGVNKTVKKLDELKQSLNLESAGKSVAQIGDKISDSTKKASDSLEKLENRFTSFFGMIKQKFISGIADEIVGVFFNIKHSFENLVSSMTSAQMSRGMQRYYDILTSVRTLVSAGVQQNVAYDAIERLGLYADQTSYSLDSMVATMSKFKTAGADIDTAARMIEGLSNAAASMGVNAQDAERAYLNLQQAYSKKVMLQNDWMSFESIPMVGTNFNQAILDAAVKVGTLEADKIDKETGKVLSYKTKKKAGTKIKSAKGITADNMGSMLQSRWFTDEVMEEVFGNTYYFEDIATKRVDEIKDKEEEIRAEVQQMVNQGKIDAAKFDEEVNKQMDEYFSGSNEQEKKRKKEEIEAKKEQTKLDYEQKKTELIQKKKANEITAQEYKTQMAEIEKNYKVTSEAIDKQLKDIDSSKGLTSFAWNAFRAGQEARSFIDVLNTLKDVISRGWAKSFELIFGKLDEASKFFTKLTESNLAEGIYAISEFRNAVLESWSNQGGRNSMLETLEYIDEIIGDIFKKIGLLSDADEWFRKNFDPELYNQILRGEGRDAAEEYKDSIRSAAENAPAPWESMVEDLGLRLKIAMVDIRDFFESIRKWFNDPDSYGVSRLERIGSIVDGFGKVFNGAMNTIGIGIKFVGNIYNAFKGVFDSLWKVLEQIAKPIFNLFDPNAVREDGLKPYKMLQDTLNNIVKVAEKVSKPLSKIIEVLGDIGEFFINMAIDTFLSNMQFFTDAFALLLEIIGIGSSQQDSGAGVLDGIADGIQHLGDVCKNAFKAVGDFFGSLLEDLRNLLGLNSGNGRRGPGGRNNGGLFANLQDFFANNQFLKDAKKWIGDTFDKVFNYIQSLPAKAFELALKLPSIIGEFINGLFYTKQLQTFYGPNGLQSKYVDVETPLKQWLDNAVNTVWTFIQSIPGRLAKIPNIIKEFFEGMFYDKRVVKMTADGPIYQKVPNELKKWLDQAVSDVWSFIQSIPGKIAKIPSLIGEFIHGIFYKRTISQVTAYGTIYKDTPTALKQWLDQAISDVWTFIKSIPSKLKKIPSLIKEFFHGLFYQKKTVRGLGTVEVKTPLKQWIDNAIKDVKAFIKDIPNKIAKIPSLIGEFLKSIFYKKEVVASYGANGLESKYVDVETPFKEWINKVLLDLKNFFGHIDLSGLLNNIHNVGVSIANGFISIFSGQTDWNLNKEWISQKIANMIDDIRIKAEQFWPNAKKWLEEIPNKIISLFSQEDGSKNDQTPIGKAISGFIDSVGLWLSSLPNTLFNFWKNSQKMFGSLFDKIIGWVTGEGTSNNFTAVEQYMYDQMMGVGNLEGASKLQKQAWRRSNPIAANLEDFFNNLVSFAREQIEGLPGLLSSGWETITKIGTIVWDAISGNSTPDNPTNYDNGGIYDKISGFIMNIVAFIRTEASNLGIKVKQGWHVTIDVAKIIGDVLFGSNSKPIFNQELYNKMLGTDGHGTAAAESYKNATKDYGSNIYNNIAQIFTNIKNWVVDKLSGLKDAIIDGWTTIKTIGGIIWDVLSGNNVDASGTHKDYGDYQQFEHIFSEIVTWAKTEILKLPGRITEGFNFVSELIKSLFDSGSSSTDPFIDEMVGNMADESKSYIKNMDFGLTTFGSAMDNALKNAGLGKTDLKKTNFFSELWAAIVDMFSNIGPAILDGIQKALDWVKKKLGEATNFLNGLLDKKMSVGDALKENMEDSENPGQENPMWVAIKNIGLSIWEMLTTTIPEFIKSAASYIGQHLPEYLSGIFGNNENGGSLLSGLLGGNRKSKSKVSTADKKAIEQNAQDYIGTYGKYANEYYMKKAKEARGEIEEAQSSAEESIIEAAKEAEETLGPIASFGSSDTQKSYEEQLKELNAKKEELEKEKYSLGIDPQDDVFFKNPDNKDAVDRYVELEKQERAVNQELEKITVLIEDRKKGTTILNSELESLNEQEEELKKAQKIRIDYENKGEENLTEEEAAYYKQIKTINFDMELKEIEKRKKEVNDALASISSDNDQKNANPVLSFMYSISDILSGATQLFTGDNAGFGKTVITLGLVILLVKQLKEIFSLTDELEVVGEAAKWTAIEIGVAGIVGILGYITYLAATDDENSTKYERVKSIFEMLGSFVKDLESFIETIALISLAKEGLETIGDLAEAKSGKGALVAVLGGIATVAFGGDIIGNGIEKLIDGITDTFGTIGTGIDAFIQAIEPTIKELSDLYAEMDKANKVIPEIEKLIYHIAYLFSDRPDDDVLMKLGTDYALINKDKFLESITDKYDILLALGMMIESMSAGLKEFRTISNPEEILQKFNEFMDTDTFATFMNEVVTMAYIIYNKGLSKFGENVHNPESTLTNIFTMISGIFKLLGSSIKDFDSTSIYQLTEYFKLLNALAGSDPASSISFSDLLKKHGDLASLGADLQKFGNYMKRFFQAANEIRLIMMGEDKFIDIYEEKSFTQTFDWIARVSEKMMRVANLTKSSFNKDKFEAVGEALPQFGRKMTEFIEIVNNYTTGKTFSFDAIFHIIDAIHNAMNAISLTTVYVENAETKLNYIANALFGEDNKSGFIGRFIDAGNNFGSSLDTTFINNVTQIATSISLIGNTITKAGDYYSDAADKMHNISDALFGIDNISGFMSRLEDANAHWNSVNIGTNGISAYVDILYELARVIEILYSQDELGNFNFEKGLNNLVKVNWKDVLPDLSEMKITPVLEFTPEFEQQAAQLREVLGINSIEDPATGKVKYQFDLGNLADSVNLTMPEYKDYTGQLNDITNKIDTLSSISQRFEDALSSIRFVITADQLTTTIGPSMDQWLGTESSVLLRTIFNR